MQSNLWFTLSTKVPLVVKQYRKGEHVEHFRGLTNWRNRSKIHKTSFLTCGAVSANLLPRNLELNPFRNKPCSLRVCSTSLLKTLGEKEKLLVSSSFSFSHSVFYLFGELSSRSFNQIWNCRLQFLSVWKSQKIRRLGKGYRLFPTKEVHFWKHCGKGMKCW